MYVDFEQKPGDELTVIVLRKAGKQVNGFRFFLDRKNVVELPASYKNMLN